METHCNYCGTAIDPARFALGYNTCLQCGEAAAKQQRDRWCIVQEYGKGGYQFVTTDSARTTLRQTNQKNPR